MPDHEVVAFLPACPPARLARMDWRPHPQLVRRSQLPPPEFAPLTVTPLSPAPRPSSEYVEPD